MRLENEDEINKVIESSDFSKEELEKLFFDTFVNSLFEGLKKRFPIQAIINKFRDLVVRIKFETIWLPAEVNSPIKMNAEFILMYLLNNSDQQLGIELMDLVKNVMTLPIYFR